MKISFKYIFFIFFLFHVVIGYGQKNKLYIFFDTEIKGNKFTKTNDKWVFYVQPLIGASFFTYNESIQCKRLVQYKDFESLLISKNKANQKVREKLEEKAIKFEKETGLKGNIIRNPPYNFNVLFDKIYLYKKIDSIQGVLYEVFWDYAID